MRANFNRRLDNITRRDAPAALLAVAILRDRVLCVWSSDVKSLQTRATAAPSQVVHCDIIAGFAPSSTIVFGFSRSPSSSADCTMSILTNHSGTSTGYAAINGLMVSGSSATVGSTTVDSSTSNMTWIPILLFFFFAVVIKALVVLIISSRFSNALSNRPASSA